MKTGVLYRAAAEICLLAMLTHSLYGGGVVLHPAAAEADPCAPVPVRHIQQHLRPLSEQDLTGLPLRRPVDEVHPTSSGFGMRMHPILQAEHLHAGIDFAAPEGAAVRATADGIVRAVTALSDSSDYGICVFIDHGPHVLLQAQVQTVYAHLSAAQVWPGKRVRAGQKIGLVGNTGRSTDFHLHYEIRLDDQAVDPLEFLHFLGIAPGAQLIASR
jgi:murein DD-endopeptidase MepM/ murein hydrolase activator NlpD